MDFKEIFLFALSCAADGEVNLLFATLSPRTFLLFVDGKFTIPRICKPIPEAPGKHHAIGYKSKYSYKE